MTVYKQTGVDSSVPSCSAEDVAEYLLKHGDFFDTHQDLLVDLSLTHDCGDAVSLIERQVALLRQENRQLTSEANELIEIARINDIVLTRIQQLILRLIEAPSMEACLAIFSKRLKQHFSADCCSIRLFPRITQEHVTSHIYLGDEAKAHEYFNTILTRGSPVCGRFNELQVAYFFGARISHACSLVVVPLQIEAEPIGVFALASHNMNHFSAEMSTSFLNYLAESCSVIFKRFL